MTALFEKAEELIDKGKAKEALVLLNELVEDDEVKKNKGAQIAETFGRAFRIMGDAKRAAAAYLDAAFKDKYLRSQRWHLSSYFFLLHYLQDIDTAALYGELASYEKLFADVEKFPPRNFSRDKIRIAYLLPYVKKSSLSDFVIPLFTMYNKNKFEVYIYTFSNEKDEFTKKLELNADVLKILSEESPKEAAETIYSDEIDILFDLAGHSEGGITLSLMAYRPAKVQICGIGWPSVLNLSFVDYILTDEILTDNLMKDNPLTLPNALCFSPNEKICRMKKTPHNIGSSIKLGVFNNFMKITDEMLLVWKEIAESLSGATLILQDTAAYPARVEFMKARLKNLEFASKVEVLTASPDYLKNMVETDIVLDTFPYTGGNMTATALTIGTPVITLKGDRYGSRFSASILSATDCEEFIAADKKDYKTKVLELAKNEIYLRDLHLNLRKRVEKSRFFDTERYMENLENLILQKFASSLNERRNFK